MVADWKSTAVNRIAKNASKYKVIGVTPISGTPSKQFQQIRKKLGKDIEIIVTRNTLVKRALKKAGLENFAEHVKGPSALIFTNLNPFKLQGILNENKTHAPPKPGSKAPMEIIIPAGDTPFAPGPIIGELQGVGIKAKIEKGKIVVTEDSLVAKEGTVITQQLANVLGRMGITPVEIGFSLSAAYEDGVIYPGELLDIDKKKTIADIQTAYTNSFNLAFNAGMANKATIKLMIQKTYNETRALALKAKIMTKESVSQILLEANAQMLALKAKLPEEAQ